jgi:diacylglycerol kinase (ATP)
MRKKAVVIVNPMAGRGKGLGRAQKVTQLLSEAGVDCLDFATGRPGQAREISRVHGGQTDVLVSIGGDGTLNEVVNGLADSGAETPVAIIPAGTANMVAKELGLPRDLASLIRLAVNGRPRRLDLGAAGLRRFILCGSAGFDASIIRDMARKRSRRGLSLWKYVPLFFSEEMRYRFPPMRVRVDGDLVEEGSSDTIIGNMSRYGAFFQIFLDARPDDGLLDVCCLKGRSQGRLLQYAWSAYWGKLDSLEDVTYYRGRQIILEADEPIPFQIDGESSGELPVTIEIHRQAISICVPE